MLMDLLKEYEQTSPIFVFEGFFQYFHLVHQTTSSNDSNRHRTNNVTEGWNNQFSHLIGIKHPTIWHLIRKMKYEVASDCTNIESLLTQFDEI